MCTGSVWPYRLIIHNAGDEAKKPVVEPGLHVTGAVVQDLRGWGQLIRQINNNGLEFINGPQTVHFSHE